MKITHNGRVLRITDAHCHIYPEKIAEKATGAIGKFYDIPMCKIGTTERLLKSGEEIGVEKYVVCSVATKPEQVHSITEFIAEKCSIYPQFVGLAAMHRDVENPMAELLFAKEHGLVGIKLHPDFQRFNIDDPKIMPVYGMLCELGMSVLFHVGDNRYDYSAPERLARVLSKYPDLRCVAAHFGGYRRWGEAAQLLKGSNLYFDTSSSLPFISRDDALSLIDRFGSDRMLFGSDFPMWDHREELDRFLSLGLPEEKEDQILYQNFMRFYTE